MVAVKTAVVMLVITVYVPMAGGINGGRVTSSGHVPATGFAACGPRYPFGTVFEILDEDMSVYGLPQVVICTDRGGQVSNVHLDLALVSGNTGADLRRAKFWGRRVRKARVYASLADYQQVTRPMPVYTITE